MLWLAGCGRTPLLQDINFEDANSDGDNTLWVWQEIGGSASQGGISDQNATVLNRQLAFTVGAQPYAAWLSNQTGRYEVYLKYWNGSAWVGIGGSDQPGGITSDGSTDEYTIHLGDLVVDNNDRPYVIYTNDHNQSHANIYVLSWNGTMWESLGSPDLSANTLHRQAWWPTAAIDSQNRLVVAWAATNIYLQRWDGSTWEEVAGSASGTGITGIDVSYGIHSFAQVKAGNNGQLFVGWRSSFIGTQEIYAAHYNGSAWVGLDSSNTDHGVSNAGVDVARYSLEVANNSPSIMWWQDNDASTEMHFRWWNTNQWQALGGITNITFEDMNQEFVPMYPTMALKDDGFPVIAYEHFDTIGKNIYAIQWDGNSWARMFDNQTIGGISNSANSSEWVGISVYQGTVYVGWEEEFSSTHKEYFLRFIEL